MKNNFISSIWDFKQVSLGETNYMTHDFLRWYGKLIPQLVSRLIQMYSSEGDLVLANFAGSGTVLLESHLLHRNSIGIDSLPLSILLCKVKTTPYIPNTNALLNSVSNYIKENPNKEFSMDNVDKKWYDKKVFNGMMLIKERINEVKSEKDRHYYMLALAAITRKLSKVDSRSINHIVLDKNKPPAEPYNEFSKKIEEMNSSMKEFMEAANGATIKIQRGDARRLETIGSNTVDLIIAHPPYLGCINYSNIFRLANKILGFDYEETKENDISTNSLKEYMEDMSKVFNEMFRVLKGGRYACVIIGDNRVNGEIIPTFSYFIEYAKKQGFKLKDIFIWLMNQKAGMSIKRHGNYIDHNYILIFQK